MSSWSIQFAISNWSNQSSILWRYLIFGDEIECKAWSVMEAILISQLDRTIHSKVRFNLKPILENCLAKLDGYYSKLDFSHVYATSVVLYASMNNSISKKNRHPSLNRQRQQYAHSRRRTIKYVFRPSQRRPQPYQASAFPKTTTSPSSGT